MSHIEHKKSAPRSVRIALLSCSSTRTVETDTSGLCLKRILEEAGHRVLAHEVVKDNQREIAEAVTRLVSLQDVEAVVTTGGTGLTSDDVTIESIRPLFEKEFSGFGALFVQLSYPDVGAACILSRATAGSIRRKPVICLPGSEKACELAARSIIVPELAHMVKHLGY